MRGYWLSVFATAAAAAFFLSASAAYADQITVFTLTTTDSSPSFGETHGEIEIDTTTGAVDAIDLNFTGNPGTLFPLSTGWSQVGAAPNQLIDISELWANVNFTGYFGVDIFLPVDTLMGYAGGNICSATNPCYANIQSTYGSIVDEDFTGGQLEPVPEPSSLLLLGMGALSLVGLFRRKFTAPISDPYARNRRP